MQAKSNPNSNLLQASALINRLSSDKFEAIMSKILEGLVSEKKLTEIFSAKDYDKLTQMLEVTERDLKLIFECILYFIERMAYFKSQKQMASVLQGAHLSQELIVTFFEVWKTRGEKYVNTLKRQQVCVDSGLKDFNWVLNMPLDYSQAQKEHYAILDHTNVKEGIVFRKDIRAPVFSFTFDLQGDGEQKVESANVQFNKTKLQSFFEEMEKIQIKIDELTN